MPTPKRDPELKNKIRQWVEKNPERWYTAKYEDLTIEQAFLFLRCIAISP